LAKSMDW